MTENYYSSFMIFMERRYRNLCLRKKNGKSFTVDLKILETISSNSKSLFIHGTKFVSFKNT